jgi:hypothetical protein
VVHFQGQEREQGELGYNRVLELGKGNLKNARQEVS